MKNPNEMPWACNKKSPWNTQGYIWNVTMKFAEYQMKNHNEMHWVCSEKLQWKVPDIYWKNHHWDSLRYLWNACGEFLIFYEKSKAI